MAFRESILPSLVRKFYLGMKSLLEFDFPCRVSPSDVFRCSTMVTKWNFSDKCVPK
jgi:hypothetical protein